MHAQFCGLRMHKALLAGISLAKTSWCQHTAIISQTAYNFEAVTHGMWLYHHWMLWLAYIMIIKESLVRKFSWIKGYAVGKLTNCQSQVDMSEIIDYTTSQHVYINYLAVEPSLEPTMLWWFYSTVFLKIVVCPWLAYLEWFYSPREPCGIWMWAMVLCHCNKLPSM